MMIEYQLRGDLDGYGVGNVSFEAEFEERRVVYEGDFC